MRMITEGRWKFKMKVKSLRMRFVSETLSNEGMKGIRGELLKTWVTEGESER